MTDVRRDLLAMSIAEVRGCVYCGKPFPTYAGSRRLVCSPCCNTARWRACCLLAGTHGYRDGRFRRLESEKR